MNWGRKETATGVRDARRRFIPLCRGFANNAATNGLARAAADAVSSGRHAAFEEALGGYRRRLDEIERCWRTALGESGEVKQ